MTQHIHSIFHFPARVAARTHVCLSQEGLVFRRLTCQWERQQDMSFFASLTGGGSQTGLTNEEIATQISVLNDELNRSGACLSEEQHCAPERRATLRNMDERRFPLDHRQTGALHASAPDRCADQAPLTLHSLTASSRRAVGDET